MRLTHLLMTGLVACSLGFGAAPAPAQSPFATVIDVNDRGITGYEIQQRIAFLKAVRTVGDLQRQAEEALIDDRLRMDAAQRAGIKVTPEQIKAGMAEFAQRANLSTEQFLDELAKDGVAPETFRDFVRAGIAWREVVSKRFAPRIRISDSEIDRALSLAGSGDGAKVLLSEIILPLTPEYEAQSRGLAEDLMNTLRGAEDFAAAAATYSAAPTRDQGGRLEWLPLGNLPPPLAAEFLKMRSGQILGPVELPNALAIFLFRALSDSVPALPTTGTVEYARLLIPGGRSPEALATAAAIDARVDACNDLYAYQNAYAGGFLRETAPLGQIDRDIVLELAKMDNQEVSTALTRGANGEYLMFLMLCNRTVALPEGGRETVRRALFSQRLTLHADSYLGELRADAIIARR